MKILFQFNQMLLNRDRIKAEQKSSNVWLNKASELLDLSSGESGRTEGEDVFGAQHGGQQQLQGQQVQGQQQGFIPQIVMNPWDPNQAPVMTLAPLANAMQAYHQQMLGIQQGQPQVQAQNGPPASVLAMAAAATQQVKQIRAIALLLFITNKLLATLSCACKI